MSESSRYLDDPGLQINRRHFFARTSLGLGGVALSSMLSESAGAGTDPLAIDPAVGGAMRAYHVPPRAKRVIYLFMSGGPSQLDLFDYKPLLNELNGQDLPASVRMGQRLTGMSANQATLPTGRLDLQVRTARAVGRLGQRAAAAHGAAWSMTSASSIAVHRGDQPRPGHHVLPDRFADRRTAVDGLVAELRPGLGQSGPADVLRADQPERPRTSRSIRGSGATASCRRCIRGCSSAPGPTRCSTWTNPAGVSGVGAPQDARPPRASCTRWSTTRRSTRRSSARIAQYEMAYRMQTSVPEVTDLAGEPDTSSTFTAPTSRKPGTFAANCLLARRLAERGVRFIQLYHPRLGPSRRTCRRDPRSSAARPTRPARRSSPTSSSAGLLDDTLVIWGGEFGRTNYSQGKLTADRLRPRPPPAVLHRLGWPAAGSSRASTYGADRRLRLQHRRRPRPRPRPPRDHLAPAWASTTSG